MISEKDFKVALDSAWLGFIKSMGLVNLLERMGLDISSSDKNEDDEPTFGDLYTLQEKVSETIITLMDVPEEKRSFVMDTLDQYLFDMASDYLDCDRFPEERYPALLDIFCKVGVELPWERKFTIPKLSPTQIYRHRALSKKTMDPVTGYLWSSEDHAYIIPYAYIVPRGYEIRYDEDKNSLLAYAIEVWKPTIALEVPFTDVDDNFLFEGDLVRIGDETFRLHLTDFDVARRLTSPECERLGLFLVRPNYDGFKPPC